MLGSRNRDKSINRRLKSSPHMRRHAEHVNRVFAMTAMDPPQSLEDTNLWYFAYGSNMSTAKFVGSRGIQPLDTARVYLPGWILTMDIPGLPYSEPAFSSIQPVNGALELGLPNVIGVAYLITHEQHRKVMASEGGGIAYTDILVDARPVSDKDATRTGHQLQVRTLGTAMRRCPPARPSKRYMVCTSVLSKCTCSSSAQSIASFILQMLASMNCQNVNHLLCRVS